MTSFDRPAPCRHHRVREAQHIRPRTPKIVRLQVSLQHLDASTEDVEAIGADALAEIVNPLPGVGEEDAPGSFGERLHQAPLIIICVLEFIQDDERVNVREDHREYALLSSIRRAAAWANVSKDALLSSSRSRRRSVSQLPANCVRIIPSAQERSSRSASRGARGHGPSGVPSRTSDRF